MKQREEASSVSGKNRCNTSGASNSRNASQKLTKEIRACRTLCGHTFLMMCATTLECLGRVETAGEDTQN